ncbi:MAG: hypothetical protein JSS99_08245 [Actinobacteria bacterium]|nr:hypothetical protein [Actinomycetota bacterium]
MRSRRSPLAALPLPLALLALAAAGCGSGGTTVGGGNDAMPAASTPAGVQAAAFDPRDAPLGCLAAKGIRAQKDARATDRLDVLPPASGAYVQFAATPAEAQGRQLRNQAPGAEVIGPHLLTVGRLGDRELRAIETCLQAQGSRY